MSIYTGAEKRLLDTLAILQQLGVMDERVALCLHNLAAVYHGQNNLGEAEGAASKALAVCRQLYGAEHTDTAAALNNLAVIARGQGNTAQAKEMLIAAGETLKQIERGSEHPVALAVLNNKTVLFHSTQKADQAASAAEEALALAEKLFGATHPEVACAANNLGVLRQSAGDFTAAEIFYERAMRIWEQCLGADHPNIGLSLLNMSSLRRLQQHHPQAEWLLQRALRLWKKPNHESVLLDLGSFFIPVSEYTETGLLRVATLKEKPLSADQLNGDRILQGFAREVQRIKTSVPEGELRKYVEHLGPWYHNIELAPGLTTNPPLGDHPAGRWRTLERFVPADLTGKSVLDIGCNAGFFSIEMKKRGARRVVGIDIMPHVLAQARFTTSWFDQPVELFEMDTYDVDQLGQFDHVVFVGVLYHLKHPLYALEKIAGICKETLYFQSVIRGPAGEWNPDDDYAIATWDIFEQPNYPKLYYIEKSFNGDVSNWWFATRSCLKAMLRTAGFSRIEETDNPDTFVCHK